MNNLSMKKILVLSIISGVILGISNNTFFNIPLSPLAWVALVPFLIGLKSLNKFIHYAVSSYFVCFLFLFIGMFAFIPSYFIGGISLIAIGAIHLVVPFIALYFFQQRIGWRKALLILPLLWPVWEWFFLQSELSMPLMAIYLTQAPLNWLIQYIDIFGYNSISFWLILLNVLIAFAVDDWKGILNKTERNKSKKINNWKSKYAVTFLVKRISLVIALMFVPPLLYAFFVQNTLPSKFNEEVKVSLVQTNNQSIENINDSTKVLDLKRTVKMTDSFLAEENTDLIVWPEAAVPFPILEDKQVRDYIFSKVLEWNTPLITGVINRKIYSDSNNIPPLQKYLKRDYEIYNSAVLITPQLAWKYFNENLNVLNLKVYRKQNLMPFTEYVPFSDSFPLLANLTIDLGDGANFSPGIGPKSLLFAKQTEELINVSPIICWDLIYPSSVANSAVKNKNFIAALTNESRLGNFVNTTAHEMEGFTRLRSIESRRSIAKCAVTGYTFFCDPFGTVYEKVPWWSNEIATANVKLSSVVTIFNRFPGYFPTGSLIIIGIVFIYAVRKQK